MATEVHSGLINDTRTLTTAGGGTALSTTAAFILFPEGTQYITVTPRNYASATVVKWTFCPYLVVLRRDGAFEETNFTDFTSAAQDADAGTDVVLSSLDTAANGGFLYVGCHLPFRGVRVDVDQANATASTLTVKYWNGQAWADISATDGTASGGATMAQDGSVTWTVPGAWKPETLARIENAGVNIAVPHIDAPLYWTRWEVSAQLDASTTANSFTGLNRSTSYAEWLSGQAREMRVHVGPGGVSGIEALTDAGTANLIVNADIIRRKGEFA